MTPGSFDEATCRELVGTGRTDWPYVYGHCCPAHGGPDADAPRVFQDGHTEAGRPMWCAVMPGFVNLQESPAGFHGDPATAVALLRSIVERQEDRHAG